MDPRPADRGQRDGIQHIDHCASHGGGSDAPPAVVRPWLAHYDAGVPARIDYPPLTLDGLLRCTAASKPDTTALLFFGRRTSYLALHARVDRLAAGLRRLGLRPGERVALFLPNSPRIVAAFDGVWRAGCIAVPVNPRAAGPELSWQLRPWGCCLWPRFRQAILDGHGDPDSLFGWRWRERIARSASGWDPFVLRSH